MLIDMVNLEQAESLIKELQVAIKELQKENNDLKIKLLELQLELDLSSNKIYDCWYDSRFWESSQPR